ncbi:MAG: 6-phosphogluconolactonase [Chloroflexi bacterium]|nr:6-phosphogluconolactonase [Chloroflexota bacterium]
MSNVHIFPNVEALIHAAADEFVRRASESIAARERFAVALSGGSTPHALYTLLASAVYAQKIDWARTHIFWGDERCVPPDHPDSNYRLAHETLLAHVPLPPRNIYRMRGEIDPAAAAEEYAQALKAFFGGEDTRFDLLLLGMGDDGHTASLFPHTPALAEKSRLVAANYVESKAVWRITLSARAINAAAHIVFLVAGAGKAQRLYDVLKGAPQPEHLPAQSVSPVNGDLRWFIDAEAALLL